MHAIQSSNPAALPAQWQVQAPRVDALAAAAAGPVDLQAHLATLVDDGQLGGFLDQTGRAIDLAQGDAAFAAELDPLLGRIDVALGQLPTQSLTRVERDALGETQGRLAAHLGTETPPPVVETGKVPGGGLEAHEAAGSHLIERHVGKTEAQLLERLSRENISASSSFKDLPSAEAIVAQALADNQGKIDAWVDGTGGNRLVLDASFDSVTGISVRKGDNEAQDTHSVKLVLERSDKLDIGYRIVTGYPTTP